MKRLKFKPYVLFLFILNLAAPGISLATTATIKDYVAKYQVFRAGSLVGKAQYRLSTGENKNTIFTVSSEISTIVFGLLPVTDSRLEISHFQWNNGYPRSVKYQFKRQGTGRDRSAQIDFDWKARMVRNQVQGSIWQMPLQNGSYDKLNYQLALRLELMAGKRDLSYQVADGGRMKNYQFKLLGAELINTPLGELATLKIQRNKKQGRQITTIWFAKNLDFVVARIHQTKHGEEQADLLIQSYVPQ